MSDMHTCPMVNGPVPHVGGPIVLGDPTVLIGFLPAARIGDQAVCVGPPDVIAMGSPTVMIGMKPAARIGDMTAHGGAIVLGCFTVLIGDTGGGGGGGGGAGGFPAAVLMPDGSIATQFNKFIIIEGTAAFQAAVLDRLTKIAATKSGKKLLADIAKSGKKMRITEYTGNNSFGGPDPNTHAGFAAGTAKGKPVFDGAGNPIKDSSGKQLVGTGKGTDTHIQFNPNLTLPNSKDPSHPMPNDAVLFHEMNHGNHYMNGQYDGSPQGGGWTTQEEKNTILTGDPSEADYLQDTGYPYYRQDHDLTFAKQPHP